MKKTSILALALLGLTGYGVSAMAASKVSVSPFSDNITIKLKNFPTNTNLSAKYHNNNDVNITGPSSIQTAASSFPVQISSGNLEEAGFPSISIQSASGINCALQFVDGPWVYLNYKSGIPTCKHITVSSITMDAQYQYELTLTYKKS